jgi:hypothetical protein
VERKEVHRHIRYSTVASTLPIAGGKLPPVLRADGTLCPMGEARIANKKPNPWLLAALTCCAAIIFTIGISWGLPSRSTDPFLFGDHSPWTGKQILALAPGWGDDANRAADVAAHPLANRDQPIVVNQTDSDRAAIVRRYRLYSDQPDEMITLRALAQMQPGKLRFDPKLYQYGGLWFYPIGGILKLASLFHLVRLTPDLAFYLDHPDAFGRLYVIMRLYSAAWGLLGLVVMFSLATRITGSQIIGAVAGICYTLLPTVINAAHEAKPHLAGAVLALIAVDFALRAMKSGDRRWAIAAGASCGAAGGMVLSGWLVVGVLPVMAWFMFSGEGGVPLRGERYAKSAIILAAALAAAAGVYAISNPYVIVHLLGDRTVLQSNLENSAAMYQSPATIEGAFHGILLLFYGGSTVIFFGMWVLVFEGWRTKPVAWLLIAGAVPALGIFLMHAAGKPGEYARFALPVDVLLVLGVAVGMRLVTRPIERMVMGILLCLMLLPSGASYVWSYGRETFGESTRLTVAERLQRLSGATMAVDAEPAPYVLPPVDLFRWKIVLLPRGVTQPADADVRVDAVDLPGKDGAHVNYFIRTMLLPTPISWAAKPFRVETRAGLR